MAKVVVDTTEAVSFEPLPNGTYEVVNEERPEQENMGKNDTPMLKWSFKVVGTEGKEAFDGRKLFRNTPMSGKGAGFTVEMLKGLGVPFDVQYATPGDETSQITSIEFDDDHTLGRRAVADVTTRSYKDDNGKERRVNDFTLTPYIEPGTEVAAQ